MMKKYLLLMIIIFQFTFLYSQNYYMNIILKNGNKIVYDLSEIRKIDFNTITNIEDAKRISHIIKSFKLLQNYPNPFNPNTTIQYEIPKSGKVELRIYDIMGRHIKTIVSEYQQAGNYKKVWNGLDKNGKTASSGFYVYTVKFENKIYSKKMILLK